MQPDSSLFPFFFFFNKENMAESTDVKGDAELQGIQFI